MLAGATRGEAGSKGGGSRVRLSVDMPFQIAVGRGRGWHQGVCE